MDDEKQAWANVMRGFEESKRLNDELGAYIKETLSELRAMFAASEKRLAESNAAYEKRQAESNAAYEKRQAESKAEYEKRQAESKAEDERRQAERKAEDEKRQAESKAEDERRQAERKAEDERRQAERKAEDEKRKAEDEKRKAEDERRKAEQDAQMAAMRAEVAGIAKGNGMFAENVFFRSLWRQKVFAGIHFDYVNDQFGGIKKLPDGKRLQDQFDIVMLNDVAAALVETKYRARKEDVRKLVEKKVENFRTMFPDYKDFKIYLGLGAFSFDDDVIEEARKYGVGLLQEVEDAVEYAADWELKAY